MGAGDLGFVWVNTQFALSHNKNTTSLLEIAFNFLTLPFLRRFLITQKITFRF